MGVAAAVLTGCGGDGTEGAQIQWIPGTPPGEVARIDQPTPTETALPTATATDGEAATAAPTPTSQPAAASTATSPAESADLVTGRKLTAQELARFKPDELGQIPVLEYHDLVADPKDEAQFARTIADFRADLDWLYKHDFYIVPLRDVIQNEIKAPAGKHPVVLTFDDSYASQFRYLIGNDGSVTIDPDSAVGIIEAMYAKHPDFGRGGFFAVIPTFCFDWGPTTHEDDQTQYCSQKIGWLLDNGYEVGNHTHDHTDLYDVTDEEFAAQVGGAIEALQEYDSRVKADIIAMPFGNYPKKGHEEQRDMLRNGFTYDGHDYQMLGALMVGANPSVSPVSTDWDPLYIPRIQAWDKDAQKKDKNLRDATSLTDWFDLFASDPSRLYTSDGDPNTITVPNQVPDSLGDTFDEGKAEGKEIVRY
jgi:peptidoglycan/xylan/chitin deacetylase (PgdA/CDA1 family)